MSKAYAAEFAGTAILVFVGCGSVVVGTYGSSLLTGALPIALSFGLTLTALIYAIGPISGCHINPAVTAALWAAGRFKSNHVPGYIVAQLAGAIAGAGSLLPILHGRLNGPFDAASGMGQNGWGPGFLGQYSAAAAFTAEFITTAVFMIIILGATAKKAQTAGVAIGAALTVIIIAFIDVTGVSLNPARSLGPAIFAGPHALSQLWLFFLAPMAAGMLVGVCYRSNNF